MLAQVAKSRMSTSDLAIHEFDQWSNSGDPTLFPTITWYEPESEFRPED